MLMPSTVASPLPTVMSPGVSSVVSSPATSIVPTITSTIQSLQQKDTTWTKLFVGGLPYHTTDKSLREHFEVYGEIEEAVVITDRSTGKSRGYGFVIMADKEAADRALKEPNPIIDGRKANVNLAILGAKPRGNLTAQLPLTAMRPGFPALLGQYGDLTAGLAGAGQLGLGVPCVTAPYTMQAAAAASPAVSPSLAAAAAAQAAPGKARSSMNLGLISGRQPVAAQTAASPYIQQLYAASASPYGQVQPNMMQLMGGAGGVTGNPLLDMYTQQYAAALGYPAAAGAQSAVAAGGVAVSGAQGMQIQPPVSQPLSLDQAQAQAQAVAGGYFGFYAPQALTAQQLTAAGLTAAAGLPAAYASPPTAATTPTGAGQPQAAETRTQ